MNQANHFEYPRIRLTEDPEKAFNMADDVEHFKPVITSIEEFVCEEMSDLDLLQVQVPE